MAGAVLARGWAGRQKLEHKGGGTMNITIEPNEKEWHDTVTVRAPADLDIDAMMELVKCALRAMGYRDATIDDYWGRKE